MWKINTDQIFGIYNNNNNNLDHKGLHTDICKHSRLHSSFLKKINLKGRISASDADIVATTDTIVTVAIAGAAIAANIAINATGNIVDATTALGSAAITTAANLCDEFDG